MPEAASIFPVPLEIYRLPRLGPAAPVIYAAARAGEGAHRMLAARLLKTLAEQAREWAGAPEWGDLELDATPLGQPLLKVGGRPGPGLSFSEAGGLLWAAVTGKGRVGVDAAQAKDFAPPYPYSRALGPAEWDWAWRHCRGETPSAAALLWAAKEAAVKALGVGFHTLDPLNLTVSLLTPAWGGLHLLVRAPEAVNAWARPLADGWLALAAV